MSDTTLSEDVEMKDEEENMAMEVDEKVEMPGHYMAWSESSD